jgi:hypothetical protein
MTSTQLSLLLSFTQVLNLCGDKDNIDPSNLFGEAIDDTFPLMLQLFDSKIAIFRFKQYQMMTAYLFENWDLMSTCLSYLKENEKTLVEAVPIDFSHTWAAVCSYDLYIKTGNKRFMKEGHHARRKVKTWADTGMKILKAPSVLLNAMASLCNKKTSWIQIELNFKDAINSCSDSKCLIFEAIGAERLSKYFLTTGLDQNKADEYRNKAIEIYEKLGAFQKADWLKDFCIKSD